MRGIELKGQFVERKHRPASFDIAERASKCLDHMLENCDEKFNYVPYVGVTLGEDPPHFVHHRLDWTEVLPYSVYGVVIARNITGSKKGEQIQLAQRRLLLSNFNELDGLIHAPRSPWNDRYPLDIWEQARALYAFIYWYYDSGEEQLLNYMDGIVEGLFRLSSQEGRKRVFPDELIFTSGMGPYAVGSLIDPLTKYYEMTGNQKALQLATGITYFMLDPETCYFDNDGRFTGFFRTVVSVINGISRLAALTGHTKLIEKARQLHDYALSFCTTYGSTPCVEPACSNMELNMSALSLARAGFDEYWDQIDRFARNQTAEAQFLDPSEWVREKAVKGRRMKKERFEWVTEYYPDDLHILPYDSYDNVLNRSVGGFMWTSANEHLFVPASLMLCCSAHAMRTFEIIWENTLKARNNRFEVSFHYNIENSLGEVISYEPYRGKVSVILKRDGELKIRIPEYALGAKIVGKEDGREREIKIQGRYAYFGRVQQGKEYSLEYPLVKRTIEEKQYVFDMNWKEVTDVLRYQSVWRGNTVIKVLPQSQEEKRIYKRDHLDTDEVPYKDLTRFISDKHFHW